MAEHILVFWSMTSDSNSRACSIVTAGHALENDFKVMT